MTKMPGKSSYLRRITRQHESNLPLLKSPRTLVQHWGVIAPHERIPETAPSVQPSSVKAGKALQLQDPVFPSALHVTELQSVAGREVIASSPPLPSGLHAPVALADGSPASMGTAWAGGDQQPLVEIQPARSKSMHTSSSSQVVELARAAGDRQPLVEIQLTPEKSVGSATDEKSRSSSAAQVTHSGQTEAPVEKKPASIVLRPPSVQQQGAMMTPTNSRRPVAFMGQEGGTSARAAEPQHRPTVVPHKQEAQQHATIHIGTIDIHIVPPTPLAPLPSARNSMARPLSTPALSREMTSFIGLRQG